MQALWSGKKRAPDAMIGGWGGESNREIDFGFVFRVRDRVVRCEAVRDDIWYARGSGTFFCSDSSALLCSALAGAGCPPFSRTTASGKR